MGECDSSYTGGGTCEPPRIPQPPVAPSGNPGVKAVPLHQVLVPLRTKEEVRKFLKAIRKDFVSTVNVVESGLHDQLRQLKVLTDTDNESLNGRHLPVPRDKASRLWDILFAMDHDVIVRDVIPALCERHYHIIPQQFWKTTDARPGNDSPGKLRQQRSAGRRSGSCLRCDIQLRVRFVTVVDFLYEHNALSDLKHRELTRNHRLKPEDWPCVFSTFASLASQPPAHLNDAMTSLLQRHSLPVPGDVLTLMTQGMPCQCRDKRRDFNTLAKKQLAIWQERCVERSKDGISNVSDETATTTYPTSDHDSSQFSSHITQSSDSQTRLKTVEPQSSNSPSVQDLDENDTATSYPLHRLLSEQSQTSGTDTYSRNTLNLRTSTPRQTHYSQARTWSGSDFQSMKKQAMEDFKVNTEVGQECCPLSRGRSGSEESLASIVFKELEDSRSVGGEHGSVGGAWTKEDGGSVCEGTIIASSQGTFVSYFRESSGEGFSGAGSSVTDTSVIKDGGGCMELEQPGTGWGDEADVQSSHHRGQVSLWPCGESSSDWLSLSTLKDSLEGLDGRVPVGTCVGGTVSPATNKSETNEGSVHGGVQSERWFLEGRESDRLPSEGTGGSSTHPCLQLTPSTASKANLSVSQNHPTSHQQDCKTNLPLHPAAHQQDCKTNLPLHPAAHQQDCKTNLPLHPAAHQPDGKTNPPLHPAAHQPDGKTNPPLHPAAHQPDGKTNPPLHPAAHQPDGKTNLPLHPAAHQPDGKTNPPLHPAAHQPDGKTNPPLHPAAHQPDGKTNPPLHPAAHQPDGKTNPPLHPAAHQPDGKTNPPLHPAAHQQDCKTNPPLHPAAHQPDGKTNPPLHPAAHQPDGKTNPPLHPAAHQPDGKTNPPLHPAAHQPDGKTNPPLHPAAHQPDGKTNPPLHPAAHQQDGKTNPPLHPAAHQQDHTNMGERSEHPETLGPNLPDVPPASTNMATRSTAPSSLPLVKKTGDVVGGGIPGFPLRSPGEQVRSPVSRLAADLSPDEEKAKRLKKALFKGHYDQVKCVLPGAALEHHNVNATSHDNDITKSCVTHPEQRESDQGEEEEEGVLQAKQNADLMEFRQYALSEVTTGADLRKLWLKKASLVDTAMTDNIQHLLESYVAMEMLYGELQQKQPGECGPMQQQDDILSQPGPQSDLTHLTSLFSKVLGMGAELLLSCRIFLLCAFYLNTPTSSTTPRYRASAHALARDVILLSDWTRLQAWQHVTQLEEMIGQLGGEGGVAIAAIPESLDLVRRFLDMELQGY